MPTDAPKVPATADEARALADRLDADAAIQEETAAKTRRSAAAWRAYARALEEGPAEKSDLRSPGDNAYNADMSQAQVAESSPRPRGAPLRSDGPVARVAKILEVSGADVAWLLDVKYQTSRAWDADGRRVPDDIAPKLEALVASPKAIAKARRDVANRPKPKKK